MPKVPKKNEQKPRLKLTITFLHHVSSVVASIFSIKKKPVAGGSWSGTCDSLMTPICIKSAKLKTALISASCGKLSGRTPIGHAQTHKDPWVHGLFTYMISVKMATWTMGNGLVNNPWILWAKKMDIEKADFRFGKEKDIWWCDPFCHEFSP